MKRRRRLKTGNEGWLTSYADLITNLLIFFLLIISASEIQMGKLESIAANFSSKPSPQSLKEAEQVIQTEIKKQGLDEKVQVKLSDAGLELEFNSGLIFSSGDANILPEMIPPMDKVLGLLPPYANRYRFAVEGHTDEVPLKRDSIFKSNWDLAAARALQVRDRLELAGIPNNKMRIESYADTKPLSSDLTKNLSRDQLLAKHRRVIIRLY